MYRYLLAITVLLVLGLVSSASGSATAAGPFTPTLTVTADTVSPDDPNVLPVGNSCAVSTPCKVHYQVTIPAGQAGTVSYPGSAPGTHSDGNFVEFVEDAGIPNGAIVARSFGSSRVGPPGFCAFGPVVLFDGSVYDGTIDPSTTTGSVSDLDSFSNWPTQLNTVKANYLSAHPGATLVRRNVTPGPPYAGNTLFFLNADGSREGLTVQGNPNDPVALVNCGPVDVHVVTLGITRDNPSTGAVNEGGVPLTSCKAPGLQTGQIPLDPNDTPPGDAVILGGSANCVDNTPDSSNVVELLGGLDTTGGVQVTFADVTVTGSTSATTSTSGPTPPSGFQVHGIGGQPTYYNLDTTADYDPPIEVCVVYAEPGLSPAAESALRLMRNSGGVWTDITDAVNVSQNVICGTAPGFSIWAVMAPAPVGGVVDVVTADETGSASYQIALLAALSLALLALAAGLMRRRVR